MATCDKHALPTRVGAGAFGIFLGASLVSGLCANPAPARADAVADFYSGQQVRFIIRTPPGGDYDQLSRLLSRHIGRHIPGNPTILASNMPGGGGIVAANYVGQVAPKDGTVLTMASQGLPVDQALRMNASLKVDLREFNWLGNMSNSNQLLAVWHTSPIKSLEDAKRRTTTIGSTGAGSVSVQLPAFYNNILGTKLKIVYGYPGGQAVDLAMERGEVEGRGTNTYTGYMASKPHYLRDKLLRPILQVGLSREPALPDVPLLIEQPVPEKDKPLLEYMSKAVAVGRPVATTPGVPQERVAALRQAFDKTVLDPQFKADAKKMGAEIRPMSGEELTRIIHDLIDAPDDVLSRVKSALSPKEADREKIQR